jgi:DNA-binding NarL/FixJ family response regulator
MVDELKVVRQGIRLLLESQGKMQVVGEGSSGFEQLRIIARDP